MTNTTKSTTPALVDEYQRALARARKAGLKILGRGHLRDADRTPIVCVSSARLPNQYHVVAVGRDRLWCDCQAGLRGKFCMHRAIVHEELLRLWRAERDRVEAQVEADLRASLLELHQAHRILDAALRRPEPTAPAITQREAGALLQSPRPPRSPSLVRGFASPDVAYLDERGVASDAVSVRGYRDVAPVTIWKR